MGQYLDFTSEYEKNPIIAIEKEDSMVIVGRKEIIKTLAENKARVLVFETYPGVDLKALSSDIIKELKPSLMINIEDYAKSESSIDQMLAKDLTDDRVFGFMTNYQIKDFYDEKTLNDIRKRIKKEQGLIVVFGFGASLIEADCLVYISLTRWEIQLRFRNGATNFKKTNAAEDILRKYKRGYFVEWPIADQIKHYCNGKMTYFIDYNNLDKPVMITRRTYSKALDELVLQPFRMVPYFDPGVWGGQWMKEVCHLDPKKENYAWCFDGVPQENSIKLGFGETVVEIPAQDLVQFRPIDLMGRSVYNRFGTNFPIRFDLLDTMEGENLSLQVHPSTKYILKEFGMPFTQDESYYILDAKTDGSVFLGFREDIEPKVFMKELIDSRKNGTKFNAKQFVNEFPVKKNDHLLIPAGTIHCSGKNTMVLEISACVYIFTFKLWDWGRLGLDGRPRPVHLEHGFNNLDFTVKQNSVKAELVNHIDRRSVNEEVTGLHKGSFLETRRYTFSESIDIMTYESVNMGNLVGGRKAIIQAVDGSFADYEIHYAETFIIPATITCFRVKCLDEDKCIIVKAHVR